MKLPSQITVFTQSILLRVLPRSWAEGEVQTLTASVSLGLTYELI